MGLKSFKSEEQSRIATSPNALSLSRGIGGLVLGALLATRGIDAEAALASAGALAATDMEGLLITGTQRWPRLQRALRIIPSTIGRKLDPIMDKAFAIPVFAGAALGGYMPGAETSAILATEVATSGITVYANLKGTETETSKVGTWGC